MGAKAIKLGTWYCIKSFFFSLFRYQVRKLKGPFQRAYGIQAGAALVQVCSVNDLGPNYMRNLSDYMIILSPHDIEITWRTIKSR